MHEGNEWEWCDEGWVLECAYHAAFIKDHMCVLLCP